MASLFEVKDPNLDGNLTELSHSNEDLMRIVSLRHKNNVKIRLKDIISHERNVTK